MGTPLGPLSFKHVCLSVYVGKGWSSGLPTSGDTAKWRKEALRKDDVTDFGGPPPQRLISLHVGNILQPTLARAYFSNLGYGIIFLSDSNSLGETAGEIKVIQVINENANHMIGFYKGRPTLTCCNMQLELREE